MARSRKKTKLEPRTVAFRRAQEIAARSAFARFEESPMDPKDSALTVEIDDVKEVLLRADRRPNHIARRVECEIEREAGLLYGLALGLALVRGAAR